MGRIRTATRRIAKTMAWVVVIAAILIGYGIDSDDARVLAEFCDGVERWQAGPEFRQVCYEYVSLSHAAMNSTPWGVRATTLIMGVRSVPGLGPQYAVSPMSQAHYDDFTRGELSAYLHLCGEQTMDWVIRDLHAIAQRGSADADIEHFLRSWKMNRPVASDPLAIAGVKRLLVEIDATQSIEPKMQVQSELQTTAAAIAVRLGYPAEPDRQTRAPQHDIFERLDAALREHDFELWRLKQISDLCSGIWAQTFGRAYTMLIAPMLTGRKVARFAGPAGAVGLLLIRRSRRAPERRG